MHQVILETLNHKWPNLLPLAFGWVGSIFICLDTNGSNPYNISILVPLLLFLPNQAELGTIKDSFGASREDNEQGEGDWKKIKKIIAVHKRGTSVMEKLTNIFSVLQLDAEDDQLQPPDSSSTTGGWHIVCRLGLGFYFLLFPKNRIFRSCNWYGVMQSLKFLSCLLRC